MSRYGDSIRTYPDELLGAHAECVYGDRSDWIAAGVEVDQALRLRIGRCDETVRQPQCTDDEHSLCRVTRGEIDQHAGCNGPKIEQCRAR